MRGTEKCRQKPKRKYGPKVLKMSCAQVPTNNSGVTTASFRQSKKSRVWKVTIAICNDKELSRTKLNPLQNKFNLSHPHCTNKFSFFFFKFVSLASKYIPVAGRLISGERVGQNGCGGWEIWVRGEALEYMQNAILAVEKCSSSSSCSFFFIVFLVIFEFVFYA